MNVSSRQSLVKPIGSVAVGESHRISKRIIGSNQPRPFLLSPEKKTTDSNTQNRVKLKIPIGLADSRNGGHMVKLQNSKPRYSAQSSPGSLRERERETSLKECKEPKKVVDLEKPFHSKYNPTTIDRSNSQEPVKPSQKIAHSPSIAKKSDSSLGLISVENSTRPSSTSSAGSIPDFPLPLAIDSNRQCSPSLRSPSFKRAVNSSYSHPSLLPPSVKGSFHSRNTFFQSYASSDALPSLCSEYHDVPSSIQTGKGNEDKFEMSLKSWPQDIFQLKNFGSTKVCSKEKMCLPEIIFELDKGSLSPSTPRFSFETRFYNRSSGLDGINHSNSNLPLVSGSELSDCKEADEKEYIDYSLNNADDVFSLISGSEARKLSPSSPKFYQALEKRQSACSDINRLYKSESKEITASSPETICHSTKLAPFIDHEKTLETKAQLKNNPDQKIFGNKARKKPTIFGFSRLPGSTLTVLDSRIKLPGKPIHEATYSERSNGLDVVLESDEESTTNSLPTIARKKRVKCCYSSLSFKRVITLMILLALILAAVILIPVFTFLFHRPNHITHPNSLESCDTSIISKCQNGGSSFLLDDKTCACICTNGFIGNTCTINMSSSIYSVLQIGDHNATLGSAVKRLIVDSPNKFGVPLNPSLILARLNSANLSFLAENALVTFNGKSFPEDHYIKDLGRSRLSKKIIDDTIEIEHSILSTPSASSTLLESTTTIYVTVSSFLPTMNPGETNTTTMSLPTITPIVSSSDIQSNPGVETSQISLTNSSYPISSSASTSAAITTTTTTVAATSTLTISDTTSSLTPYSIPNETTLEFARIVTLYIMQQINLNEALNVQSSLQRIFNKKSIAYNLAQNITLNTFSSHVTVNLLQLTLDLGDGKGILGGYKDRE